MVPPPENAGDEFPDFENMTPEQQMAWLESLAKRQGASDEEFTTAADLDIPIPENAVIDEPGYVPYSISERPAAREEAPPPEAEPEPTVMAEEEREPALAGDEAAPPELEPEIFPEAEEAAAEEPVESIPWLEDLAAQPVGEQDEFALDFEPHILETPEAMELEEASPALMELGEDAAAEWDLETEFGFEELEAPPLEEAEVLPEPEAVQPAEVESGPVPTGEKDLLAGADPMLWLESLAARQGVSADELITSADLEVEIPEDAVIDEPGYVPYDVITDGHRPEPELEAGEGTAEELPGTAPDELLAVGDEIETPGGADAMTWLESLARRQGVRDEELVTAADLDIPELPDDTVIEEPGYVSYSPFGEEEEYEEFEPVASMAVGEEEPADLPPEFDALDEPLSWLEDLAAEPETLEAAEPELKDSAAAVSPEDPLGGMTDEEIAYAQAHGQLTPDQELAWVQRQAARLAEARLDLEAEQVEIGDEAVGPAEPGALPGWLEQIREEDMLEAGEEPALLPTDADVSEWLADAADEVEQAELLIESDVDLLWAEASETQKFVVEEEPAEDSELAAFIRGDFALEEPDQLAEALDEEYDRRLIGDELEPAWYTEAVAKAVEVEAEEEVPPAEVEIPGEPVLAEASPVDMPDWLRDTPTEADSAPDEAMPSWLIEEVEPAAEEDAVPDWLAEVAETPEETGLDWLPAEEPLPELAEAAPPPGAMEPEIPATIEPAAIPEGDLFAQYRERLEDDPNDYATRLALARALRANQQVSSSLDQYEVLVNVSQLLQDVSDDLTSVLSEQPADPRMHRLLGDTYMRRGMLQDALEAYRSALDRL
ncbi:MAG: hypothetical protein JXJ20_05070 [Anaerolineae bacterium]|nr:hypothetical protein [Anaerolineae bacterium]